MLSFFFFYRNRVDTNHYYIKANHIRQVGVVCKDPDVFYGCSKFETLFPHVVKLK